MKIVTWNCNGAFRRKFESLEAFGADLIVIQECEDPAQSSDAYLSWAGNYIWRGYGKNKGIGIFARKGRSIATLDWPDGGNELFLPVRIDDEFDVLGVWTQVGQPRSFGYIAMFGKYLQLHRHRLGPQTLICGDFNSNKIWDKPSQEWTHSKCIQHLKDIGFCSLYHSAYSEEQGNESKATFFLHRHLDKPYHIDYLFAHTDRWNPASLRLEVGSPSEWIKLSDHMPIIVEL